MGVSWMDRSDCSSPHRDGVLGILGRSSAVPASHLAMDLAIVLGTEPELNRSTFLGAVRILLLRWAVALLVGWLRIRRVIRPLTQLGRATLIVHAVLPRGCKQSRCQASARDSTSERLARASR